MTTRDLDIEVTDLRKPFMVPEREAGLRASLRSLFGWVLAGSVAFTAALAVFTRWSWRRGLRRYAGASA